MNGVEYCVLCGKEISFESGKHYCLECERLHKDKCNKEKEDYGNGNAEKSEN